ncbi:MAG: two-component system nitrate/nitrite response regulator NarL [Mariniblastus sp.]|jgi:two-component system nitrate/nitrite response regulator NarL
MNQKIQVMLVEDHPEYRRVIQLSLEDEKNIELTFQVGSAERAIAMLRDRNSAKIVDLILLDLNLPGMSGLDALLDFRTIAPEKKIIILSQSGRETDVMCAIQRGASGYLMKSSTVSQVVEAIQVVAAGGALLDSGVAKFVLNSLRSSLPPAELEKALSKRELQILTLFGDGLLKKEVAKELGIQVTSVATYTRRMYEKLDVQNAPAAIAKAYRMGLFSKEGE